MITVIDEHGNERQLNAARHAPLNRSRGSLLRAHRPLLLWFLALGAAIVTHKLGLDLVSVPLTFGVIGAGFACFLFDLGRSAVQRVKRPAARDLR